MFPKQVQRGPLSRYVPAEFKARTLEELGAWAGEQGPAAVEEARCYAAEVWKMGSNDGSGLRELHLFANYQRKRLGMPRVDNKPWRAALAYLTRADRERVTEEAQRVLAAWEAAGSPFLTNGIEITQQLVHSARCAAEERQIAREAVEPLLFKETPACPA